MVEEDVKIYRRDKPSCSKRGGMSKMKLPRWSISECRDGHYRSKEDLRNQSEEAKLNAAAVDSVEDALSRESQNPVEISGTRIGKAYQEAAGIPAMLNTARYGFREMGFFGLRAHRTSEPRKHSRLARHHRL